MAYNPDEPRDDRGRWTDGGGVSAAGRVGRPRGSRGTESERLGYVFDEPGQTLSRREAYFADHPPTPKGDNLKALPPSADYSAYQTEDGRVFVGVEHDHAVARMMDAGLGKTEIKGSRGGRASVAGFHAETSAAMIAHEDQTISDVLCRGNRVCLDRNLGTMAASWAHPSSVGQPSAYHHLYNRGR